MKKLNLIFTLLITSIFLVGCESSDIAKLKKEIEATDNQCPYNLSQLGDLLNVKYDGKAKEVKLYISIRNDKISLQALEKNKEIALQTVKLSFAKGDLKNLLSLMAKAKVGVSVTFKSSTWRSNYTTHISSEEIAELEKNPPSPDSYNKFYLDNFVFMLNSSCPYKLNDNYEMVKVADDGKNIIISFRVNDKVENLDAIKKASEEFKINGVEALVNGMTKDEMSIIVSNNRGLMYQYYGETSGKSVEVEIPSADLEKAYRSYRSNDLLNYNK